MKNILVLRGGALGDFIVTLPALGLLRQRWPNARIDLVGNASAAQLALNRRLVDYVHSQHAAKWSALYRPAPLPEELAGWLGNFDLVISYWPDPEGELRARFPRHGTQTFLFADPLPRRAPAAAHYCEPLSQLGLGSGKWTFPLTTHRPEGKVVALHPGSGSPAKNWPVERWAELARALRSDFGADVIVLSGEAEASAARALADLGTAQHARPLEEVVSTLASASLFIGHDSGIGHLAAASGTPCLLLFGPTDPAVWAPPAPHVRVVQRGAALSAISVEEVLREVARRPPFSG
jgi:ADP-heptose:LPS heptosyltransferase